jgi:hypothetical protein
MRFPPGLANCARASHHVVLVHAPHNGRLAYNIHMSHNVHLANCARASKHVFTALFCTSIGGMASSVYPLLIGIQHATDTWPTTGTCRMTYSWRRRSYLDQKHGEFGVPVLRCDCQRRVKPRVVVAVPLALLHQRADSEALCSSLLGCRSVHRSAIRTQNHNTHTVRAQTWLGCTQLQDCPCQLSRGRV